MTNYESLDYGAGGITEHKIKMKINKEHVVGEKAQGKRPKSDYLFFFIQIFSVEWYFQVEIISACLEFIPA